MILCEHKYMGYDFHTYLEKYVGNLYPCQAWIIRKIAGEHDDFIGTQNVLPQQDDPVWQCGRRRQGDVARELTKKIAKVEDSYVLLLAGT